MRGETICTKCEGSKFWQPFKTNCQNSRAKGLLLTAEAIWHKHRGSYDSVDLFLAPLPQFISDLTSQRIPKEKIRVLRNGIEVDEYQPHYDDAGYCLYIGRLSREKGIQTLLHAHASLYPALPLKIVGTGPLKDELREQYPDVDFMGYKARAELKNIIAKTAFVIVPSEWYENCSMVLLEAMALGKPVIGSRIGGIPEQVEDGVSGFLFEMGNVAELAERMREISENKELRLRFGRDSLRKN